MYRIKHYRVVSTPVTSSRGWIGLDLDENHIILRSIVYFRNSMAFSLEVPDFPIIKHLGAGGFGSVDLIDHPKLGRVAYKKLTTSRKVSETDQLKLMKEAEIQQNLRHSFIVVLYEATVSSSACGLFLEYMKYGPVDDFVEQYTVPSGWKLQIIYDVSLAILYLHEQNPVIIHGDLKCQNILIGNGYHAKISDFGLALTVKRMSSCEVEQDTLSGTIEYIAPGIPERPLQNENRKVRRLRVCDHGLGNLQPKARVSWLLQP